MVHYLMCVSHHHIESFVQDYVISNVLTNVQAFDIITMA